MNHGYKYNSSIAVTIEKAMNLVWTMALMYNSVWQ